MNWQHLKAILWLRWRLSVNQWRRGGILNAILGAILLWGFLITSVASFFVSVVVGIHVLPKAQPDHLLLVWDGIVILFLFLWVMGLVTELQKSEALSLEKMLHLPISPGITFVLNYLSSLVSFSLALLIPVAMGLTIALTVVKGSYLLIVLPLLASFVFMITAITHQFRSWLFALMVNKRRRRTIIVLVTTVFIILVQVPNLLNFTVFRGRRSAVSQEYSSAVKLLEVERAQGKIDSQEYSAKLVSLQQDRDEKKREQKDRRYQTVVDSALLGSKILPIGWLPYGVREAARGHLLAGILGSLGATALGLASLLRSYRTTLRFYRGETSSRKARQRHAIESDIAPPRSNFLEKRIIWATEPVTSVCLASLRSMMRAPEVKLMLLTPVILFVVFGGLLVAKSDGVKILLAALETPEAFGSAISAKSDGAIPEVFRPVLALGAISVTLVCFVQLQCNLFGFDRDGFRVYVLSPCRRQDILLGKNLAIAPLAIGMCVFAVAVLQAFLPMRISHLLATLLQSVSVYLLFCLLGNLVSVVSPSAVSAGSFKPQQVRISTIIVHATVFFLSPLAVLPAFTAWGAETLLTHFGWVSSIPLYFGLSVAELALIIWAYRRLLPSQGRLLQQRETKILGTVTANAE